VYKTVSKFMQRRLAQGYVSLDDNKRVRTGGKPAFRPVPDSLKKAFQSKTFVNGRVSSKVKGLVVSPLTAEKFAGTYVEQ